MDALSGSRVLAFIPPFDFAGMLEFLQPRCVPGVEALEPGAYRRTVPGGWLRVSSAAEGLRLEVADGVQLDSVIPQVRRLFDLDLDPGPMLQCLGDLAADAPGLRVPGSFDPFEMAVRAVLGQQVTVRAAHTLAGRLAERFGVPMQTGLPGLSHLFPSAATVADIPWEELARLGMPGARARAIQSLAQAVTRDPGLLEPGGTDPAAQLEALQRLPGIGPWTAHYFGMRALRWTDAFPHGDLGVKKALGVSRPTDVLRTAERWRPYRAYATLHLWRRLGANADPGTQAPGPAFGPDRRA